MNRSGSIFLLKNKIFFSFSLIAILFVLLFNNSTVKAQYCEPYSYNAGQAMWIDYVWFGSIDNWSYGAPDGGYTYYQGYSTQVQAGSSYYFDVETNYSYYMYCTIWIDYDQSGDFSKDEIAFQSSWSDTYFYDVINIPSTAQTGWTRMRVMTEYEGYGSPYDPCQTLEYGETEDYDIEITAPPADAGISNITSPKAPFSVGKQDIIAVLNNYEAPTLTSCDINWSVSLGGTTLGSGTYYWSGSLDQNKTENVTVTNFNFQYPVNGPYTGFDIQVWTSNPNGSGDINTGNDSKTVKVTPKLNDAGVTGVFGPVGGFGPGTTNLRARIMNYGPKPLSTVVINWSIDGVTQTPFTATGLNIAYGQTGDINFGSYNFQLKTPLSAYSVIAWTSTPNGVTDEDATNDSYTGGIGPSLVAGIYYIGGTGYHFKDMNAAVSYLNSSSIMGPGTVEFYIRPGTYNAQLLLNVPFANSNPVVFRSSTGNANDVIITANATASKNYIFAIDGMNNITFRNLTFMNNNSSSSLAGTVLDVKNAANFTVTGCSIWGVTNPPRTNEYRVIVLNKTNNLNFTGNLVNNGSIGIDCSLSSISNPTVFIDNNEFIDFTQIGINYSFTSPILPVVDNVVISNNKVTSPSNYSPRFGISVINGCKIINNHISNINGSNSDNTEAAIKSVRTLASVTFNSEIGSNKIDNCTNVNGIYGNFLDGTITAKLYKNFIDINTSNSNLAGMQILNSKAYFGNNMVMSTVTSMKLTNSVNNYLYYNSIVNNSNSYPALDISGGIVTMKRNLIANEGTSYAIRATGSPKFTSDENNIFTAGTNLASLNGANILNLAAWQTATNVDKNSLSMTLGFEKGSLHLATFVPQIVLSNPLFNSSDILYQEIENADYDGDLRTVYYVGSDNIQPVIQIYQEPETVRACVGTTGKILNVGASGTYGIILTYQWCKDGVEIPGQTKAILNLDDLSSSSGLYYDISGLYSCRVGGPGGAKDMYSEGALVNVYGPTEITRQPANTFANLGDSVTVDFGVHTIGLFDNDLWQPQIQWYRNDTLLKDNARIAGTKSNVLKIRDVIASDLGCGYSVKVKGMCSEVMSDKICLQLKPDINIKTDLFDMLGLCEGITWFMTIDAEAINGATGLTYQWRKDGIPIPGANSNTLDFASVKTSDAGDYDVVLTINEGKQKISKKTIVRVNVPPTITNQPDTTNAKIGDEIVLVVEAGGTPPFTYQWYKGATKVPNGTSDTLRIPSATAADDGTYFCVVGNMCAEIESQKVSVTVTYNGYPTDVVDNNTGGYILSENVPNPFSDATEITFISPKAVSSRLVLTDVFGSELVEIFNGTAKIGENKVRLTTSDTNLSSGVYYYSLIADGKFITKKMLIVK